MHSTSQHSAEPAQALPTGDDDVRKIALVLAHGLRADQTAASAFVASPALQHLTVSDYQQRVEALRMFGCVLPGFKVDAFGRALLTDSLPKLVFAATHAYAPWSAACCCRHACIRSIGCSQLSARVCTFRDRLLSTVTRPACRALARWADAALLKVTVADPSACALTPLLPHHALHLAAVLPDAETQTVIAQQVSRTAGPTGAAALPGCSSPLQRRCKHWSART